ncbi:DNA-directed RNA polymerase subunit delta [Mycoplasma sp. SG1]|uniref:DNA-directed RNA polymerase subunit delta n=1 Tax=Mycoplasma sp. SG1 TaxID=2810348 RepID=UPI002024A939|nr:DNA-directed RNA polymerase subunit delta [Mycoplasma sp. SG1]URM52830.1 DNA-directed RNA polymerase subunit delta [Mycoplasma sp. SG1]
MDNPRIITTDTLKNLAKEYIEEIKEKINFYDLWDYIAKKLNLTDGENKKLITDFYIELILDKRFIMLGNNQWFLRKFLKISDVSKEISKVHYFEEIEDKELEGDLEESDDSDEPTNIFDEDIEETEENK